MSFFFLEESESSADTSESSADTASDSSESSGEAFVFPDDTSESSDSDD